MSTPNDGGPAFPPRVYFKQSDGEAQTAGAFIEGGDGMSLRQHFAGLAMAALLGREDTLANGAEARMFRELARLSYAQADAMIAEGTTK